MFNNKLTIIALLSVAVFFGSAFTLYALTGSLIETEKKPEPIECQRIYAKAKACIEMESRHPDRFKYNP